MTAVGLAGGDWTVDERPVHAGRVWRGLRIEGLSLDSRMANGAFDDLNPLTRQLWACPDTGEWAPNATPTNRSRRCPTIAPTASRPSG